MTFTIKGSHLVAILITLVIGIYMYFGHVEIGGTGSTPTISERDESSNSNLFRVSIVNLESEKRIESITLRGRTQADALIPIKSETSGILRQRLVNRGDIVEKGQLVCVIDRGAREANLSSAQAVLEKANAEFIANETLQKKGFATNTKLRTLRANLDAAKAQIRQAEIELARTEVRSSVSGMVLDPIAETGDVLGIGGTCVTIVDTDPMYFIGQLSESDVGSIKTGMEAEVDLISGIQATGKISYISPASDPQTRTYRVEIRLDKTSTPIRDGMTATSKILVGDAQAYRISPSWITLGEDGQVGLKTLNDNDEVEFTTIKILSQGNNGFWIENLEEGKRVITLGQEYVIVGEKVEPVIQEAKAQETQE